MIQHSPCTWRVRREVESCSREMVVGAGAIIKLLRALRARMKHGNLKGPDRLPRDSLQLSPSIRAGCGSATDNCESRYISTNLLVEVGADRLFHPATTIAITTFGPFRSFFCRHAGETLILISVPAADDARINSGESFTAGNLHE